MVKKVTGNLYTEISKVAGITPNKGEPKTDFLVRLVVEVGKVEDSVFNSMSAAAQRWFNTAGEAINKATEDAEKEKKEADYSNVPDLPGCPSFEEGSENEQEQQQVTNTNTRTSVSTTTKVKGEKPVKAVKKKTTTKKTEAAPTKPTTAKAVKSNSTDKYFVKNTSTVKRGFLKDFVEQASKLKQFSRDELATKVKGKACTLERAVRYFNWCTAHSIFAKVK